MSDQRDAKESDYLSGVNADLMRSLRRCRALVDDCRGKLAANSNEPFMLPPDRGEDKSGQPES